MSRSIVVAVVAAAVGGLWPSPADSAEAPQTFTAGAQLLRQPVGSPWEVNLFVGAKFGTTNGTPGSPLRRMTLSFPRGARFNADAFGTCQAQKASIGACPDRSRLGSGSAARLGMNTVNATITVYNGPVKAGRRTLFFYSNALGTIEFTLTGVLRRTSGRYGYVLDVTVPPIVPELVPNGVPITSFETTIGGTARKRGRNVPLVSAPVSCRGGWSFPAVFAYADNSSSTSNAQIPRRLTATSSGS